MTSDHELERLLDGWFSEGPVRVADRVIDDAAARLLRQPQRPAWRLHPWRLPPMSTPIRLALLAGALLIAAVGGAALLSGAGDRLAVSRQASPAPTSAAFGPAISPSLAPRVTASSNSTAEGSCDSGLTVECVLTPGAHRSRWFTPLLSYTVPSGWTAADDPSSFRLAPSTGDHLESLSAIPYAALGIDLGRDLALEGEVTQAPNCPGAQPGTPRTADAIVHALAQRPDVLAGPPGRISLGGLSGWMVDLQAAPENDARSCLATRDIWGVPELSSPHVVPWVLPPGVAQRLIVLDLPRGENVVVVIHAKGPDGLEPFLAQVAPILDSFSFAPN